MSHTAAWSGARQGCSAGSAVQATQGLVASQRWQRPKEGAHRVRPCPSMGWHLPTFLQHRGCVPSPSATVGMEGSGWLRVPLYLSLSPAGCWAPGNEASSPGERGHPLPSLAHAPTRASSSWHTGSVFLAAQPSPIWYLSFLKSLLLRGGCLALGGGPGPHCSLCSVAVIMLMWGRGWAERWGGKRRTNPPKTVHGSREVSLGALGHHGWLWALGAVPQGHLRCKPAPSPKLVATGATVLGRGHIIPSSPHCSCLAARGLLVLLPPPPNPGCPKAAGARRAHGLPGQLQPGADGERSRGAVAMETGRA